MAASCDAVPQGRRPVRCAALLALAMLALQAAWVLAVPPFRGSDEFDHAYRAAAVAHGQWIASDRPVLAGRGDYVEAPASLVAAATKVCGAYRYTGPDNCRAARTLPDGFVEVASAAARYNPAFYWVVGTMSSAFGGTARLYALRVAAALLCALLVGAAGYAVAIGTRTSWPFLGLAVAGTPVLVYSTSLGAPNGVEMCSGLVLWAAVVGLRARWLTWRQEQTLLGLAVVAASILVTTRLLGPVWLAAVLVAAAPLIGPRRLWTLVRTHRRLTGAGFAAVAAATAAAAWWTVLARPNSMRSGDAVADLGLPDPLGTCLRDVPLWVLQSVAAAPLRDNAAPITVYCAWLLALWTVGVLVLRRVPARWRWWLAGSTLLWLGMQLVAELATYEHVYRAWQGRYALPFVVGVPVAATALVEQYVRNGPPRALAGAVIGLVSAGHVLATVDVLQDELRTSPLSGDPAWVAGPAWLLVLLGVLGVGLGILAARVAGPRPTPLPTEEPPASGDKWPVRAAVPAGAGGDVLI